MNKTNFPLKLVPIKLVLLLAPLALASGCATVKSEPATDSTTISSVRAEPEQHQDEEITWGGTVVSIENRSEETWIEIVDRPLYRSGVPNLRHESSGRFLAIVPGFLDPLDYSNGRSITITGTVGGSETRKIEDADYSYPTVAVSEHRLWTNAEALAGTTRRNRYYSYRYPYYGRLGLHYGHGYRYGHRYRYGRSYGYGGFHRRGYGGRYLYGSFKTGRSRY